jgi:hypothetical protein
VTGGAEPHRPPRAAAAAAASELRDGLTRLEIPPPPPKADAVRARMPRGRDDRAAIVAASGFDREE